MLDLKQLTADVCCIANAIGSFLREERKKFRAEYVVEKCTHDYVSYVDKAVYRTVINKTQLNENVDYVVFASPSEVEGLRENNNNYIAVCIGNKTANEAEKSGLKYIVAKVTSDSGIINAIKEDLLK